jgi:hypothetical protein
LAISLKWSSITLQLITKSKQKEGMLSKTENQVSYSELREKSFSTVSVKKIIQYI